MPGPDQPFDCASLDPEDAKILTLARVARQRAYAPHTGVAEGAAVRDTDGPDRPETPLQFQAAPPLRTDRRE